MKSWIRVLAAALALMLVLGVGALAEAGKVVATGNVNVRSGPGTEFKAMTTMQAGESAVYMEQSASDSNGTPWYYIQYGSWYGWVSSKYANLGSAQGGQNRYVQAVDGQLNLRTGPARDYESIGVMKKGDKATYLESAAMDERGVTWYKVSYGGKTGWVSSMYAQLKVNSASAAGKQYVEATEGNSNLRTGPGLDYADIGTLKKGQTAVYLNAASVDERGVVWYQVQVGDKKGWVSSKFTELRGSAVVFDAGKVRADEDCNVRSGPGLAFDVLTSMKQGETASYLNSIGYDDRGVAWYRVNYKGVIGWVSSKYASTL